MLLVAHLLAPPQLRRLPNQKRLPRSSSSELLVLPTAEERNRLGSRLARPRRQLSPLHRPCRRFPLGCRVAASQKWQLDFHSELRLRLPHLPKLPCRCSTSRMPKATTATTMPALGFRPTPILQPSVLSPAASQVSEMQAIRRLCLDPHPTPRQYSGKRPIRRQPLGRQPIKGSLLDSRPTKLPCLGKRLIRRQLLVLLCLRSARQPIKMQHSRRSLDRRPIHPLPSMLLLPPTTARLRLRLERTSPRRSPSLPRVVPRLLSVRQAATGETPTGGYARHGAGVTRTSRRTSTEHGLHLG